MAEPLGKAGRRARRLALSRIHAREAVGSRLPIPYPLPEGPLPLVQTALERPSPAEEQQGVAASPQATEAPQAERDTGSLSPDQVADRVYQLLRQDLRWERERRGR